MKELITEQQAHQFVILLSVLVTLAGMAWAVWRSREKGRKDPHLIWPRGTFFVLLGPLVFALWTVYNAIENHYGLDSVKALLINLVLFVAVGLGALWAYLQIPSWFSPRRSPKRR